MQVQLEINGQSHELEVAPVRRLVDVLRHDLGLTGTKESCAVGVCGACSVLVDGELVSACLLPVALAHGRRITTIEGLAGPGGELTALQAAFIREGGLQCGATGTAYAAGDIAIEIDGVVSNVQRRVVAANTSGVGNIVTSWSLSSAFELGASTHTIRIVAKDAGGTADGIVAGSNPLVQGRLTVQVIKL